jgi:hypothetical protein
MFEQIKMKHGEKDKKNPGENLDLPMDFKNLKKNPPTKSLNL